MGETLTANTSGIADEDGLSNVQYEYQWLADDSDISGATNATYTLVAADEGKVIKVRVSFTDDEGNAESLTSAGNGRGGGGVNSQQSGHRSAHHQWHGAGGRDADGGHVGHRRR